MTPMTKSILKHPAIANDIQDGMSSVPISRTSKLFFSKPTALISLVLFHCTFSLRFFLVVESPLAAAYIVSVVSMRELPEPEGVIVIKVHFVSRKHSSTLTPLQNHIAIVYNNVGSYF